MRQKISQLFTKFKVQRQLTFMYIIAVFIPVIIIGTYLIYNSRSLLLEHYEQQSISDNLRVRSLLLDMTADTYNIATTLASDKDLLALLSEDYSSFDEGFQAVGNYEGFKNILSQTSTINRISVYTTNTTIPEYNHIYQLTEEIEKTSWYEQALSHSTPFWRVESAKDSFQNTETVLCLHYKIYLPKTNSFAFLSLSLSNNHLKNRIENSSLNTVLWLDEDQIFYNTNKNDTDFSTAAFSIPYHGRIDLEKTKVVGATSALSLASTDGTFYMASLNYEGYPYINKITTIYIAILLFILLGTTIIIFTYSRYFSSRVITLRETMHEASCGNYNITDTFQGEDEISLAFEDLNLMIQDILKKELSVYEAKLHTQKLINRQQQMEFKMLTSQINPHFLYNTLETIRMRAIRAGNREVANAIKLLGKTMRYVLENSTTSFTNLQKELDYIESYLSIQKLRFHDKINYELRIDSEIIPSKYKILPLIIQPIVENAFIHGLEEVEQGGKIMIHIKKVGENLHIQVYDNGCGMTKEDLKTMLENIYHHPKESAKSIGLSNIYQRIQLCYGKNYGIWAESKKGFGTLFTIILPYNIKDITTEVEKNEIIHS